MATSRPPVAAGAAEKWVEPRHELVSCYGSLVITGLTNSADTATDTSVLRHRVPRWSWEGLQRCDAFAVEEHWPECGIVRVEPNTD